MRHRRYRDGECLLRQRLLRCNGNVSDRAVTPCFFVRERFGIVHGIYAT